MRTLLTSLLLLPQLMMATTLTGSLKYPNATGATGTLYLKLNQQAALSAAGSCGGPIEVLPNYPVAITVTSGSLAGTPTVYGNDCLSPQTTYYIATFQDVNGNTLFTDWWQITGSSMDIGTVVSVLISGTNQTFGSAGVVLTAPIVNQTVTQPSGTKLSVNALSVTSSQLFPDGSGCNTTYCQFNGTEAFPNGLGTGSSSSSTLYVGSSGKFVMRVLNGADATCGGEPDGSTFVRKDLHQLQVCLGGALYRFASL